MVGIHTIYTRRNRQENDILIKEIWDAYQDNCAKVNDESVTLELISISEWVSGKDIPNLIAGSEKFGTQYHPSLFSLLDEYERSMPVDSDGRIHFEVLNRYLFCLNFPKILAIRKDEIPNSHKDLNQEIQENIYFYRNLCKNQKLLNMLDTNKANRIKETVKKYENQSNFKVRTENHAMYEEKCSSLMQELKNTKDRERLPQILSTAFTNAILYHLDKLSSREETLSYLRGENIELPLSVPFPRNKLPNRKYVNRLKKFLTSLKRKADVYGFGLLKELTEIAIDYLDQCDLLTLKEFEGDYIQGTGICGNCSMVFVSNALSSIDSTCKFLYEYGPDWIYLPADLNYIACPFCNTKRNIDSPAMFHSFERMQTIYCITSNWIQNETQAVEVFTPIFKDIRNRYKKRLSKEQISMFNKSSVLYTYGRNQFIYAIQMGDVISEGHTYEIRRTPDGNGLLIDSAKKVSIGVPKELLVEEENEDEKSVLEKAAKLKLAIELRNSGDLIKSKDILENLIKVDPNNRIANANLALVLNDIGEKERSQEIFQNLAKNEGLGNEFLKRSSYFQRGMELADSRRYKEAIKCYDAALSFDPNYLNALDSKGYSLFRLEKYKEATACYDRVLQSAAEDSYDAVLAWTNKGAALSKLGKYEEAINCYDKAIEKEMQIYYSDDFYSHYCLVWYNNGVTLTKLGKYEEALKLFDKSLEIDAKHDKSWYWRARSKIKMGNTNEGLVDLKKAIELDLQFIKLAKQEQDFEKIRNDKQFLKLVAMNENTLVQKASKEHTDMGTRTVEQDSEWEEDVETCLNILSYMPNFAETYYGLGVTLNKFGEFEEAIKLFDRALEIDSRHAASWYGRARANIKIGNTERSLIDLKKAIELDLQFIKLAKQEQDFEKLRSVRWFAKLLTKYK